MLAGQRLGRNPHADPYGSGVFNFEVVAGFDVDGNASNIFGATLVGVRDLH